ncbi:DUF6207 family protein [Streptomyces flaveolus]|uniref:DUF6207 family protein n=1 Tax=Streptomyces flaveolus TaxID=67297 RepID=UPI0036F6D4C5
MSGLPPGLSVVVDVAATDDETAFAFHAALATRWATTSVERTTRDAGQAGGEAALLPRPAPAAEPARSRGGAW